MAIVNEFPGGGGSLATQPIYVLRDTITFTRYSRSSTTSPSYTYSDYFYSAVTGTADFTYKGAKQIYPQYEGGTTVPVERGHRYKIRSNAYKTVNSYYGIWFWLLDMTNTDNVKSGVVVGETGLNFYNNPDSSTVTLSFPS